MDLPVARSRAWTTSSSPSRENTNTRSPTTTGDEWPTPTLTFQPEVSAAGHAAGAWNDARAPSRRGPRHWGQSWAEARDVRAASVSAAATAGWRMGPPGTLLEAQGLADRGAVDGGDREAGHGQAGDDDRGQQ